MAEDVCLLLYLRIFCIIYRDKRNNGERDYTSKWLVSCVDRDKQHTCVGGEGMKDVIG